MDIDSYVVSRPWRVYPLANTNQKVAVNISNLLVTNSLPLVYQQKI